MTLVIETPSNGFAGRTFESLVQEVLAYQFSAQRYESLVKTWLNDAVRKFVLQSEIRIEDALQTFSTVSGSQTLEVPSNFYRLIDLTNKENGQDLEALTLDDFDSLPPESSGIPDIYAVEDEKILLYPIPNGVYQISLRYRAMPADMVAPTDEPGIPKCYHDIPIAYAMWKAYLRENDYQAASTWEAIWEKQVQKARGETVAEFFDGPQQVQGMWGSEGNYVEFYGRS